MRTLAQTLSLFLLTLCSVAPADAEGFRFEGGSVEIPAGFTGPVEQRRGSEFVLYGFSKRHPGRETATLMQITVFQPSGGVPQISKDQEPRVAEKYLLDFLAGVERRRTNFSRAAVDSILVDGKAMARVRWRGRAEGQLMAAAVRSFETASLGGAANRGRPPTR